MKKITTILAAIILFGACKERIVYVRKPTVTDTTVLKAQMQLKEWRENFDRITINSQLLYSKDVIRDTGLQRKCFDSIAYSIRIIDNSLGDSILNPIFKK